LADRASFVIKQANGAKGEDVHVGRHIGAEEWQAVVDVALESGSYVAQEFCDSLPFLGQGSDAGACEMDFIWGIFAFGRHYGGSWIRMMPRNAGGDGVINSARGAQETIVYEVAR